jgi:hypothetical protein
MSPPITKLIKKKITFCQKSGSKNLSFWGISQLKRIAIMQPTYLPWCGYFGMMHSVDLFIFLDSVQFDKRSWQQRNQIKSANGAQWLTVPVLSKGKRTQKINQVELDISSKFDAKHIKSIDHNYKKTSYFDETSESIFSAMKRTELNLAEYNIGIVETINKLLGITTKTICSSNLSSNGNKADLLSSICVEVGATEYISPPGSKSYIDETDAFDKVNLPVKYFKFKHPTYKQLYGDFIENISIVDLLMNCGNKSLNLIESGAIIE